MFAIAIALIVLALAIGAIVLILKNMSADGVEIAAPGSCRSGRCGVRCAPAVPSSREETAEARQAGDDAADRERAA